MTNKRSKKHTPEQIVSKLRDAEVTLNTGKYLAAVLQSLEVSEQSKRTPSPLELGLAWS